MKNYTSTIELTDERDAVFLEMLAKYNTDAGLSLTASEYLATIPTGAIESNRMAKIATKGSDVVKGALMLPDEKRLQFTADVEVILGEYLRGER